MIRQRWFSLKQVNKRIDSFKYFLKDRRDKPCTIPNKSKRFVGGAWKIFNFLRLFPLIIEDKIQNIDNEVWQSLLLLTEIVEITCASEIRLSCLSYLDQLICQYLSLKRKLFSLVPLHPKHHFVRHYPYLILEFGPLIKVWTMRFESKRTFFKRAIRYLDNFINVYWVQT